MTYFNIDPDLVQNYLANQDNYIRSFDIKENNKIRKIVTYKDNTLGQELNYFHYKIASEIYDSNKDKFSKYSYAYKRGVSCKDAFTPHINSVIFYKLDISDFFNSIDFDRLHCYIDDYSCSIYRFLADLNSSETNIYKSFFYKENDKLVCPVGFRTSPIVSELYLNRFDTRIEEYIKDTPLHYSRYCDDILISCETDDIDKLNELKKNISMYLYSVNLSLNEKKTKFFNFKDPKNNVVSYLGLNMRKNSEGVEITIPRRYIDDCLKFINRITKLEKDIKKNMYILSYLYLSCNSKVRYIEFNSKKSFNLFLDKYKHIYNKDFKYYPKIEIVRKNKSSSNTKTILDDDVLPFF